jgi:hypothetical protein
MDSNYNVYMTPQFWEKNHPKRILFADDLNHKDGNSKEKGQKNNNSNNNTKQNNKNNHAKGNCKAITNPISTKNGRTLPEVSKSLFTYKAMTH